MIWNGFCLVIGVMLGLFAITVAFGLFGLIGIIFSTIAEWIDDKIKNKKE